MLLSDSPQKTLKFIILFVSVIFGGLASALSYKLIPFQLLKIPNGTQILSFGPLITIPFVLIGGWLSDKIGRPFTILIALFLAMLGNLLLIFSTVVFSIESYLLPIAYILSLALDALVAISFWAFVMENSPINHRSLFFALVLGTKGLIYKISTDYGVALINRFDFTHTMIIGLVASVVSVGLLIWFVIWEHGNCDFFNTAISNVVTSTDQTGSTSFISALKWLIIIQLVNRIGSVIAGSGSLETISKLLGLEFEQQMALLRAQYAYDGTILALGIMLLFGWLSDKFGERPILILTLVGIGIGGAVPFVVRQGFYSLDLQILSAGFCSVAISPGFNSWLSKIMSGKKMGIRYGIFSTIGTVVFYLLIPIQSFIPKRPQSIAVVAIVAFLVTALFIWFKFKLPAHSTEQEGEMIMAG
jgi:hypothetical protein